MSLWRLAIAQLLAARLASALNAGLMALGTASIVLLLLMTQQLTTTLARDARGIDLVIGAKGSPLQLVLSAIYHADVPTGNIDADEARRWAEDPRVASAIPLALGDSYRGFRIVGTSTDYLTLYATHPRHGRVWRAPMEAVVGALVARESGLGLGDRFAGSHGLFEGGRRHEEALYTVVGVLAPTGNVIDRLVLTSLDSVRALHDHGDTPVSGPAALQAEHAEHTPTSVAGKAVTPADPTGAGPRTAVAQATAGAAAPAAPLTATGDHLHADPDRAITALLLRYATPLAAVSLPRQINAQSTLQAAAPAVELSRLLRGIGVGLDGLRAFAVILVLTAGLGVFTALYGALEARRHDMAMLRCLGATRFEVWWSLMLESLLLTATGVALGLVLGHAAMQGLGVWLARHQGVTATGAIWAEGEAALLVALLGLGAAAAALPAWRAYRRDVARTLSEP